MNVWAFVKMTGCPLVSDSSACSSCAQSLDLIRVKLWVREHCTPGEIDVLEFRADSLVGRILMRVMRVRAVPTFIVGGKRLHSPEEAIAELGRVRGIAARGSQA